LRKVIAPLKAVILVGGLGTRLRPLTDDRPKSVVPVLNFPAIEHTFAYLKKYSVAEIILAVNYLPDVIERYFGDGSRCGIKLIYNMEKEPLGTAGAVKNAARFIDGTFFVFNGDIFTDLNLAEMLASHRKNKAKATISLTWVDDPSRFGVVETDTNQRVKRFIEKPPLAEATTHWINAGTYILEPDVLDHIPENQHYMFENGLYPGLLKSGEPVYGFPYRGFWLDMGTPATYFSINADLLTSKVASPLVKPLKQGKGGARCGANVTIHPSAKISPPVIIGSDCYIGAGVRINGPVVMGPGCRLEDSAVVENTILWDNVTVRANSVLTHCVACSGTVIQDKINDMIITKVKTAPLPK
jgi:mannose-1-phosphate guanylyltransferase